MKKILTKSTQETKKLAKDLASKLKGGEILALSGDLGAGKTTFVQGFAKGLGIREKITSPTFVVAKRFPVSSPDFQYFYHIDMYRIPGDEDVKELGLKEVFNNNTNLVIIEWSHRVSKLLPKGTVWVKMSHGDREEERVISVGE